ncbi:hypothetical protein Bbelb_231160 [Branchiostoma belcheri]|nr:hypothetical protein Bbelb_231160 [Branchiostoma belcheri]
MWRSAGRQQQPQTGTTGGTTTMEQSQAESEAANPAYGCRADATYAAEANRKTKCWGLCKKLWQFTGVLFVVANAIVLPYFAVKTTMLAEEFAQLNRKTELRLSELNLVPVLLIAHRGMPLLFFERCGGIFNVLEVLLDLREKRETWDPPDLQGKWDQWGRLDLGLWAPQALQEQRGPWGQLALWEKREPWGQLAPQEKGGPLGPLALCLSGRLGRPVCRDAPSALLDHRDIPRHPDAPSLLEGLRGTCYKFFSTPKTFSEADEICRKDGGTLAMPRDEETNAYLNSLSKTQGKNYIYWIGLHYQREKGKFKWVDGSALGEYSLWQPGQLAAVPRPTTDLASPLISVL